MLSGPPRRFEVKISDSAPARSSTWGQPCMKLQPTTDSAPPSSDIAGVPFAFADQSQKLQLLNETYPFPAILAIWCAGPQNAQFWELHDPGVFGLDDDLRRLVAPEGNELAVRDQQSRRLGLLDQHRRDSGVGADTRQVAVASSPWSFR